VLWLVDVRGCVMIRRMSWLCLAALLPWLMAAVPARAAPPTPDEVANAYSDEEIIDGFMRTVFGAEGNQTARTDIVHKFTGPVRVLVVSTATEDRTAQIGKFIGTLNKVVDNLNIRLVKRQSDANMVVFLVDRSRYQAVIRETLPKGFDTRFIESSHCSGVTGGKRDGTLESAYIYIPTTEGWRQTRHCMVEEITQSLGPVNDDWTLPNSIYNDYSDVPGLGVFDWFILNTLYDRRIRPGMTPDEVRPILPKAIADARKRLKRLVATKVIDPAKKPGE
jgi:hypothetical protein